MCNDEPVKIVVGTGPNATTWYIHRALLIKHSPYFRAALEPYRFAEASSNSVFLPDDDSNAFRTLAQWIYTVGIAKPKIDQKECLDIVKAYCLGDKLGMPQFKNDVLIALGRANYPEITITPESVIYAFEHTISGSGLRALLADILATSIQDGAIKLNADTMYSQSDASEVSPWLMLFESGGEYVSAVLNNFVGGNTVKSWVIKKANYLEDVEGKKSAAGFF